MLQTLDRFGRIDILVNNAGLHQKKYNHPFGNLARDDIRALFEVNVMGIINCSLACRSRMEASGGGAIVNIASAAGHTSHTPYGVSKLAARGVTVALAAEFADDGIRVNAISPGFVGSAVTLGESRSIRLLSSGPRFVAPTNDRVRGARRSRESAE